MDFSDIRSYPERIFSTYWHKVIEDPHFKILLEHLSSHHQTMRKMIFLLKAMNSSKA